MEAKGLRLDLEIEGSIEELVYNVAQHLDKCPTKVAIYAPEDRTSIIVVLCSEMNPEQLRNWKAEIRKVERVLGLNKGDNPRKLNHVRRKQPLGLLMILSNAKEGNYGFLDGDSQTAFYVQYSANPIEPKV
ncbi:MAG: hypothetical protein ABIG95_03030 [Candidatus Woesearchaeota archaeon]